MPWVEMVIPQSECMRTENTFFPSNLVSAYNRAFWIEMIEAQLTGQAALPHGLGLDMAAFHDLVRALQSDTLESLERSWRMSHSEQRQRSQLYADLLVLQAAERNQLIALLTQYAHPDSPDAMLLSIVIASACLASGHLWKSLGLCHRARLRELLTENYPELVAKNTADMRWKRFFYRSLCENGGDYVCKAPNCVDWSSYSECFTVVD